jgi:hypothetical protein
LLPKAGVFLTGRNHVAKQVFAGRLKGLDVSQLAISAGFSVRSISTVMALVCSNCVSGFRTMSSAMNRPRTRVQQSAGFIDPGHGARFRVGFVDSIPVGVFAAGEQP